MGVGGGGLGGGSGGGGVFDDHSGLREEAQLIQAEVSATSHRINTLLRSADRMLQEQEQQQIQREKELLTLFQQVCVCVCVCFGVWPGL